MLSNIINSINNNINKRSSLLCNNNRSLLFGLASTVLVRSDDEDDKAGYPALINNEGECRYVFADDDYSFGVYHRLINRSYNQDKKSFGNANSDTAIDEVNLICWGFRNQLKMDALSFENQVIIPSLPKEALLIQSVFDKFTVFNSEFKNIAYDLIPEQFLFSVKYKVQYNFNRKCLEIQPENKC